MSTTTIMSPRSETELREQPATAMQDRATSQTELDEAMAATSSTPATPIASGRAYVLISCSISQLPIWGFAMTYGIFQEYYLSHWTFKGSKDAVGVIGTTSNGVMYLSMPILFALLSRRFAQHRRLTALIGVALACLGFLLSSFSTAAWHLVLTQGVVAALGCTLIYSPTTLSLSEHFSTGNRALALGVVLSSKNITGTTCPFLLDYLLTHHGLRPTLWIWTALLFTTSLACILTMPMRPTNLTISTYRRRRTPWSFLTHKEIYIHTLATLLQSSGYGLPQTYLTSYARSTAGLTSTSAVLLLVLFNAPGIFSSAFFGALSDGKRFRLSATTTSTISAVAAALAALLLWGLAAPGPGSLAMLIVFAVVYGFFAGGYSATWGGVVKEMEGDAAGRNEAIDSGVIFGLLNGARGVGYVTGGLAGVQLLKAGDGMGLGRWGYGTAYGPVILYTGLATACGGAAVGLSCWRLAKRLI